MLRFRVFTNGKPAETVDLSGAYLVGSDGVPVRAEISFDRGEVVCKKRATGPAGLALVWPVNGSGRFMLETTRLQERDRPYILQLELARSRLMRLSIKHEDWSIEQLHGATALNERYVQSRDLLIQALQTDDEAAAAKLADQSLALSVPTGEEFSLHCADAQLGERNGQNGIALPQLGCSVDPWAKGDAYKHAPMTGFDYVSAPICWRHLEPTEQKFQWKPLDELIEWAVKNRMPVHGKGLVNFSEDNVPDWLYIWEHDFETIRDLVYEHIRRVVDRYGTYVRSWSVVSGLHAGNCVSFNFEQLMELTRMAAATTKQLAPRATTLVDLVAPWGEYYARNQRTIPPALYADMALQSGVNFDAFGLQFYFGLGNDGMYVRDMFQVSSMIDRFANRGKPLHITGVQVPSSTAVDKGDAFKGKLSIQQAGAWKHDWSEELQSQWLEQFYRIALSKPFVESITWRDLTDGGGHFLPHGGLLRADLSPKPAFHSLQKIREAVRGKLS